MKSILTRFKTDVFGLGLGILVIIGTQPDFITHSVTVLF